MIWYILGDLGYLEGFWQIPDGSRTFPSQKELGILGVTEMCYGVPAVKGLSSLQRLLSLTVIKPSIMVGIQFANWTITMFDRWFLEQNGHFPWQTV